MEPQTGPLAAPAEVDHLGQEAVRLPRLREAAGDLRRGTPAVKHRRSWIAAGVVVVVGATAYVVDAGLRAREGAEVTRCESQLRLATGYTERRLGLIANYLEPTLKPSGRVQELHLADLMSARAGRVLPRVQRADRVCGGVSVSPWHFSLVRRQSDATAYSAALVAIVQTVAAQGTVPFSDDASLQDLRDKVGIDGG